MSKYIDILVGVILLTLLVTTLILPINYFTTTISALGFFMNTPILHTALAISIFLGGAISMCIWSVRHKSIIGGLFITTLAIFGMTGSPIFEWMGFWILCVWVLMRLLKWEKQE